MRVAVDQARHDQFSAGVDPAGAFAGIGLDLVIAADGQDSSITDSDSLGNTMVGVERCDLGARGETPDERMALLVGGQQPLTGRVEEEESSIDPNTPNWKERRKHKLYITPDIV